MDEVVILIDTGIDVHAFAPNIIGGKHFYIEDSYVYCDDNFNDDENGHGSACAYTILSVFPLAKFYVIKALDKNAETIYPVLETALEYCLGLNYHIINLSLSLESKSLDDKIFSLCNKLKNQDKVLVSSVYNGYRESYPASYNSVIGVRGSLFTNAETFWYNTNFPVQCIADITPRFTNRSLDNYFIFGGNSKACALVTGMIMKFLVNNNLSINFDLVNYILEKKAKKNIWLEKDINTSMEDFFIEQEVQTNESIISSVCQMVCDITGNNFAKIINWNSNLFKLGLLNSIIIKNLIITIENYFNLTVPNIYINYNSLSSINRIANMIEGIMHEKN